MACEKIHTTLFSVRYGFILAVVSKSSTRLKAGIYVETSASINTYRQEDNAICISCTTRNLTLYISEIWRITTTSHMCRYILDTSV